ncbi:hypothetical protein [Methylocystis echinoides]|jgi:hypothetical protein|uniref:hypothetical protein n=1 Tax=Methylocystis echinoides TaxID=29468 RepID=UPI00344098D1
MGRGGLILAFLFLGAALATAQEKPKDIIAAHVRLQGYPCDAPISARRDTAASRPDESAWVLVCKNARYRVRLVPHLADIIEPL